MRYYLLDTCIIIDLLNRKRETLLFLQEVWPSGLRLGFAMVTWTEVYAGMRTDEEQRAQHLLSTMQCYEFAKDTAVRAGRIKQEQRKEGVTIDIPDALIAATALEHDLVLVTHNVKDFRIKGLKVASPKGQ